MEKKRKIIYLAAFLFSIPIALTSYINSSFLENYISKNYIGIIYIIASMVTILWMARLPKILNKFGNRFVAMLFSVIIFASLSVMALGKGGLIIPIAFVLYFVSSNFIVASLDIFIEDFSKAGSIGRSRGFYLTIISSAWVIAQTISGSIINKSSFGGIYLLSALFIVLFYMVFIFLLKDFKDKHYIKTSTSKTMKFFLHNRNISKIYLINLILKIFFAWMIIYIPIYLHQYMGFAWDKIGIIFTIMLIPFVILEFPLGRLSDKIGEKKMLIGGFIISGIATLSIPLIVEPKLWIWALVLFSTRVGAATIEVMSESYFFKSIKEENADAVSFFRNTGPLSFIIAPLLATITLFFVPSFEYLFFILGAVLLCGIFITLRIRDVR